MTSIYKSTITVHAGVENPEMIWEPYIINVEYTEFDEEKETLVLLHGYLGAIEDFYSIISEFKDQYNILAIDLRGHGKSDTPENINWGIEDLASDILQVINILIPGEHKVSIIASSMATAIALELTNRHPIRVEKLLLISAGAKFVIPSWVKFAFGLGKIAPLRVTNALIDSVYTVMTAFATEAEKEFLEEGLERFKRININIHRRIFEDAFSIWEASVDNIYHPVFIIAGEEDNIIPYEETLNLMELLQNASLLTLIETEHHILINEPEVVIGIIYDFLHYPEELMKRDHYSSDDLQNDRLVERPPIQLNQLPDKGTTFI